MGDTLSKMKQDNLNEFIASMKYNSQNIESKDSPYYKCIKKYLKDMLFKNLRTVLPDDKLLVKDEVPDYDTNSITSTLSLYIFNEAEFHKLLFMIKEYENISRATND